MNVYPLDSSQYHAVPIRELEWLIDKERKENLTCWLHQVDGMWKVFECAIWPVGAVF